MPRASPGRHQGAITHLTARRSVAGLLTLTALSTVLAPRATHARPTAVAVAAAAAYPTAVLRAYAAPESPAAAPAGPAPVAPHPSVLVRRAAHPPHRRRTVRTVHVRRHRTSVAHRAVGRHRATPTARTAVTAAGSVAAAVRFALAQVGGHYRWGAAGRGGYDCSGLVMAAYARAGIRLPHSSGGDARYGRPVPGTAVRAGDLLGYRGHVAIALDAHRMVEAANPRAGIRVTRLRRPAWVRRLR